MKKTSILIAVQFVLLLGLSIFLFLEIKSGKEMEFSYQEKLGQEEMKFKEQLIRQKEEYVKELQEARLLNDRLDSILRSKEKLTFSKTTGNNQEDINRYQKEIERLAAINQQLEYEKNESDEVLRAHLNKSKKQTVMIKSMREMNKELQEQLEALIQVLDSLRSK